MKIISFILLAVLLAAIPAYADSSLDLPVGAPVTFSLTIATGSPPTNYQWKKDGVTIQGATSATYRIPSVTSADAGVYTCAVGNKAGTVLSDNGIFTITTIPGGVTVSMKQA